MDFFVRILRDTVEVQRQEQLLPNLLKEIQLTLMNNKSLKNTNGLDELPKVLNKQCFFSIPQRY